MTDIIPLNWLGERQNQEPLPHRLAKVLREAITTGKLQPGEQLPAENELAKRLGVSRTTLRAAVELLLSQGLLERRHGVGTFVSTTPIPSLQNNIAALLSTTRLIRDHGYEPGIASLEFRTVPATPEIADALRVPVRSDLLHISRTRTASGTPVFHGEEYLPTSILTERDLPQGRSDWSLYQLLNARGFTVKYSLCKIRAANANETLSKRLNVPPHFALLLLCQTVFTTEDQPVLYCENYHNSSILEFQVLRRD